MEELILSKDILKIKGCHQLKREKVTSFLRSRNILPVKKIKSKNLFSKKEILESIKKKPYRPNDKGKVKPKIYDIIDKNVFLYSKDIQNIYADRLPKSALNNFSSWALLRCLKPAKKIKINNKLKLNIYRIDELEEILTRRDEKKKGEYFKEEEERNSDCIHYLNECLPKAAIKNKKINCLGCFRYQKKEFKYYETT